jgi:hypothetical protein
VALHIPLVRDRQFRSNLIDRDGFPESAIKTLLSIRLAGDAIAS